MLPGLLVHKQREGAPGDASPPASTVLGKSPNTSVGPMGISALSPPSVSASPCLLSSFFTRFHSCLVSPRNKLLPEQVPNKLPYSSYCNREIFIILLSDARISFGGWEGDGGTLVSFLLQ